jgi:hypothetical protein
MEQASTTVGCYGRGWPNRGANRFELGNRTDAEFSLVTPRSPFPSFLSSLPPLLCPPFSPPSPTTISNMARGRKAANGTSPAPAADSPSDSTTATPPPRSILPIPPTPRQSRDVVKVNNASLTELKNALDDAIKRVRIIISRAALSPNNVIRTRLIVPIPTRSFQANSYPH